MTKIFREFKEAVTFLWFFLWVEAKERTRDAQKKEGGLLGCPLINLTIKKNSLRINAIVGYNFHEVIPISQAGLKFVQNPTG